MAKNKKVEISLEEKLEKALVPVDEQPYKLPDSWVWTRLGEVSKLSGGSGFPEKYHKENTLDTIDATRNYLKGKSVNDILEDILMAF